ncbi:putative binding protein [Anaeramoeba ignava]|uniref:Binding protein n=1 Tax=Anaeramoeba ignava TaxID=1746090 RepID=A0A9Q0RBT3_ANAIG|nr:putative binding protein [Anaeramoeba ignava]
MQRSFKNRRNSNFNRSRPLNSMREDRPQRYSRRDGRNRAFRNNRFPYSRNRRKFNNLQERDNYYIWIYNLDYEVDEEDLKTIFSEFGGINSIEIKYDLSGRSEGSAKIAFQTIEEAEKAVNEWNGKLYEGKPMKVEIMGKKKIKDRIRRSDGDWKDDRKETWNRTKYEEKYSQKRNSNRDPKINDRVVTSETNDILITVDTSKRFDNKSYRSENSSFKRNDSFSSNQNFRRKNYHEQDSENLEKRLDNELNEYFNERND